MKTQNKQIADYLRSGKKLTPLDALYQFGCMRLASRIGDLRKEGMPITTNMRQIISAGKKKHIAEYYINGTEKKD